MVLKNTEMSGKSRKNRYKALGYLTLQITSNFQIFQKCPEEERKQTSPQNAEGCQPKQVRAETPKLCCVAPLTDSALTIRDHQVCSRNLAKTSLFPIAPKRVMRFPHPSLLWNTLTLLSLINYTAKESSQLCLHSASLFGMEICQPFAKLTP